MNGQIDLVDTGDDSMSVLGIVKIEYVKTFSGITERLKSQNDFPFSKKMEDEIGWNHNYANVHFYISSEEIDPTTVESDFLEHLFGLVKSEYNIVSNDFTGYLWTEEEFTVGGHSLLAILNAHKGEYIHLEIELFSENEIPKDQRKKVIELKDANLKLKKQRYYY